MNSKQRRQIKRAKLKEYLSHTCPECGERGKHWISKIGTSFYTGNYVDHGFWTCAKFYDPVTKRRIGQH
jgi:ribosomal protein L32